MIIMYYKGECTCHVHVHVQCMYSVVLVKLMQMTVCVAIPVALSRNKETEDNPEFSLSEGDEVKTEQALQEAFDQATGQQNQQQQVDQEQGMSLPQDSLLGLHSSGKETYYGMAAAMCTVKHTVLDYIT